MLTQSEQPELFLLKYRSRLAMLFPRSGKETVPCTITHAMSQKPGKIMWFDLSFPFLIVFFSSATVAYNSIGIGQKLDKTIHSLREFSCCLEVNW